MQSIDRTAPGWIKPLLWVNKPLPPSQLVISDRMDRLRRDRNMTLPRGAFEGFRKASLSADKLTTSMRLAGTKLHSVISPCPTRKSSCGAILERTKLYALCASRRGIEPDHP